MTIGRSHGYRTPRQQRASDPSSEDWLTERVLELADQTAWPLRFHIFDARRQDYRSNPGLPDWLFARPGDACFLELKGEDEQPTGQQLSWLAALDGARVRAAAVRPSQLQLAADLLSRKPPPPMRG
jgi:hypothetical protein